MDHMPLFVHLAFLLVGSEIRDNFTTNFGHWVPYSIQINNNKLFLATYDNVFILNLKGNLERTIVCPIEGGFSPTCFTNIGDTLFARVRQEQRWLLCSYNTKNNSTQTSESLYMQLFQVDGQLFGTRLHDDKIFKPLVTPIDIHTLKEGKPFFKKPIGYSTPGIPAFLWLVREENFHLFAISANNRIYFYNRELLKKEIKISDVTQNANPFIEVSTPMFNTLAPLNHAPMTMNTEDKTVYYGKRMVLASMTVFFGKLGDGFVYCYTVPDELDGIVIGNHVAIRFLDARLQPVGEVLERYGQVAGVVDDGLVVFYPDGPEPPVTPAGMRAHYGVDRIESRAQLVELYSRFRALETRTLDPVIEIIPISLFQGK